MATGNRWGRAIGAGVLVQMSLTFADILLIIFAKRVLRLPMDELMSVAHLGTGWIGIIGGLALGFLFTRWALGPVSSSHMAHALVAAVTAMALHSAMNFSMFVEGHAPWWMFYAANACIAAGAITAALLASRRPIAPAPSAG